MAELLSSKIIITEEDPTIRSFPTLPSAVLAILGVAEKGPIATPQLITSFEEYQRYFGNYVDGYQLALAVRAYFLNGGNQAYVSRVVHYTDPTIPATKTSVKGSGTLQTGLVAPGEASHTGTNTETFDLEPGDTFIGDVEAGGNQIATVAAVAASEENGADETFDFSAGGETLTVKINQGSVQTVTFQTSMFGTPAAGTAEEVAQAINAQLVGARATVTSAGVRVTIESDRRGTGSYVEITGGTANSGGLPLLGFPTAEIQGTGNVGDVDAVTAAEIAAMIALAWTNGSGVTGTVVSGAVKITTVATGASVTMVIGAGTGNTVVGFTAATYSGSGAAAVDTLKIEGKYDGAYANSLLIKIAAATSGEADEFNLQVLSATGVVLESFANVTMDDTADRFVESVVNHVDSGSTRISVEDLDAGGTPTTDRPANVSGAAITSGDDGLTGLDYLDYTGDQAAATGLYAFDLTDDITILAIPDSVHASTQKAMIAYAEVDRKGLVFCILDPDEDLSITGIKAQQTALGAEGVTEYASLYWPRVKIINPSKAVYGSTVETVTMAPSGTIAGIMANNDNEEPEGPFFQPAGVEGGRPLGLVELEREEAKLESTRDIIYPKRICPITYLRSYGIYIDGSRTLRGDGNFPSIGERRGVSHIEALLTNGLQWVRHKNNTPALRRSVYKTVYAELHSWMRRGAFATANPSTAFFVDVSDALNPPSVVRSGQLVMRIGMATNTPAEFLIIKVTKDTRALDEELFGQG